LAGYARTAPKTIPRRAKIQHAALAATFLGYPCQTNDLGRCAGFCFHRSDTHLRATAFIWPLRKVNFHELLALQCCELGWIALAIAATFLQIFVGVLRWRESAPRAVRRSA